MKRLSWAGGLVGVAVVALTPVLTAKAGAVLPDPTPGIQHVDIYGGDHFLGSGRIANDFNFFPENITVTQGSELGFVNYTDEGHTMALTPVADVPHTTRAVFDCNGFGPPDPTAPLTFCAANLGTFFADPTADEPTVAQIDVGTVSTTPDTRATATVSNPLLAGVPILEASFDTVGPGDATDSTIIGPGPDSPGFLGDPWIRTVVVNAAPGTYDYICTIHPWMQGTITVT